MNIPVLDKGFVRLIDHMGSDLTVVNAARVSFAKKSETLSLSDCGLIAYLAKHRHDSPFCHPHIQLDIKMPIFVARQWMRSGVGIRLCEPADPSLDVDMPFNEVSRRYVDDEPEFYEPAQWRGRPKEGIKQGSSGVVEYKGDTTEACLKEYKQRLAAGVAPEMARMCLPVNMYTEFWMTCSLMAAHRVVQLRCDPHAQWEVQEYARALAIIGMKLFPVSWAALNRAHNIA